MKKVIDTPFLKRERGLVLVGLMRSSGKAEQSNKINGM